MLLTQERIFFSNITDRTIQVNYNRRNPFIHRWNCKIILENLLPSAQLWLEQHRNNIISWTQVVSNCWVCCCVVSGVLRLSWWTANDNIHWHTLASHNIQMRYSVVQYNQWSSLSNILKIIQMELREDNPWEFLGIKMQVDRISMTMSHLYFTNCNFTWLSKNHSKIFKNFLANIFLDCLYSDERFIVWSAQFTRSFLSLIVKPETIDWIPFIFCWFFLNLSIETVDCWHRGHILTISCVCFLTKHRYNITSCLLLLSTLLHYPHH